MDVVDRNEDRLRAAEREKRGQEGECDRLRRWRWAFGLAEEERSLQCSPLGARQLRGNFVEHVAEQIADRRERDPGLDFDRTGSEDPIPEGAGSDRTLVPDGGLADSRLAFEQQDARPGLRSGQEGRYLVELTIPSDDCAHDPS